MRTSGDRVNHADAGNARRQGGGAATEQSTHSAVSSRGLDGVVLKCMRVQERRVICILVS